MGKNFNQATIALQELRDSREMINKEKIHCEQQLQQFATNLARAESDKASLDDQLQRIRFDHQNLGVCLIMEC
jgi:myosin protein heavy chain